MTVWAPSALFSLAALVAAAIVFLLPETTNKIMPEDNDDEDEDVRTGKDDVRPSYSQTKL